MNRFLRNLKHIFLTLLNLLKGLVFVLWLFIAIFIINLLQIIALPILPFSTRIFRQINCFFAYLWWGSCTSFMRLGGVKVHYSGDNLPLRTDALIIANHQTMCDIPVLLCLAQKKHNLSNLKWFVKYIFKYIPGLGWGMQFLDNIFLKRTWTKDNASIKKVFSKLINNHIPFWLVSFLEGTRKTPFKMFRSYNYCKENNLPTFKNLLAPRTKGFIATMFALRAHIDGVYDISIVYPGQTPTLFEFFCGKCKNIYVHIRRFPITNIPQSQDDLQQWVWDLFVEKDQILDNMYNSTKKITEPT